MAIMPNSCMGMELFQSNIACFVLFDYIYLHSELLHGAVKFITYGRFRVRMQNYHGKSSTKFTVANVHQENWSKFYEAFHLREWRNAWSDLELKILCSKHLI